MADGRAGELTPDKAYDSPANHAHLAGLGLASGISRRRPAPPAGLGRLRLG